METMETTKRYTIRVGDQLIVTDIDITQRTLPARVQFATILAAVTIDRNGLTGVGEAYIDFEGFVDSATLGQGDSVEEAKLLIALEVADLLEEDGVEVVGRPEEGSLTPASAGVASIDFEGFEDCPTNGEIEDGTFVATDR
jgi:hypothetical protein